MQPGVGCRALATTPLPCTPSTGRAACAARASATSSPDLPNHLASYESDLRLQRQVLRADIVAREQRHAAEHAGVVPDELVVIIVSPSFPRIETEPPDLVQAHGADEVLAHQRRAARGNAAAALDATIELVDLVCEIGVHRLLDPREVDLLLFHV